MKLLGFVVAGVFCVGVTSSLARASKPSEVYSYLNQSLPADGEYDGIDSAGSVCTVIIQRLASDLKVAIMPTWGGFGVLSDDDVQVVDQFDQHVDGLEIKTHTHVEAGGASETSYGVLSIKRQSVKATYTVGLVADLLKKHPRVTSCTLKK